MLELFLDKAVQMLNIWQPRHIWGRSPPQWQPVPPAICEDKLPLQAPTTIEDTKTGKTRQNISFTTLALPCFNEFYGLFYANGIKIVPTNIANYITPVSLAYWRRRLPDDGGCQSTRSGWRQIMAPKPNAFTKDDLNLAPS